MQTVTAGLVITDVCWLMQLAESVADNDDMSRQLANVRRKLQRGNQDMADLRLHLEEQVGRNAELEKKQRKWDYCCVIYSLKHIEWQVWVSR